MITPAELNLLLNELNEGDLTEANSIILGEVTSPVVKEILNNLATGSGIFSNVSQPDRVTIYRELVKQAIVPRSVSTALTLNLVCESATYSSIKTLLTNSLYESANEVCALTGTCLSSPKSSFSVEYISATLVQEEAMYTKLGNQFCNGGLEDLIRTFSLPVMEELTTVNIHSLQYYTSKLGSVDSARLQSYAASVAVAEEIRTSCNNVQDANSLMSMFTPAKLGNPASSNGLAELQASVDAIVNRNGYCMNIKCKRLGETLSLCKTSTPMTIESGVAIGFSVFFGLTTLVLMIVLFLQRRKSRSVIDKQTESIDKNAESMAQSSSTV